MSRAHWLLVANSSTARNHVTSYELANECVLYGGKNFSYITNIETREISLYSYLGFSHLPAFGISHLTKYL